LEGYACVGCRKQDIEHQSYSLLRSPAPIGTVIQFSGGGSAHEN
jgi:hypothetical protein